MILRPFSTDIVGLANLPSVEERTDISAMLQ